MRVETSRGTYEVSERMAAILLSDAIDGLASRLTEFMDQPGWEDFVTKDEFIDAGVLKQLSEEDYRDIYEPLIEAYEELRRIEDGAAR